MQARSKTVLGADLSISARRPLAPDEEAVAREQLPSGAQMTAVIELYSMVRTQDEAARLVKIKAVGPGYPFYGGAKFSPDSELSRDFAPLENAPIIFAYNELMAQMNLSVGDVLEIGATQFTVDRPIFEDSTAGMGASFAPTIYISIQQLLKTQLITEGSIAWHSRLFQIPEIQEAELKEVKSKIFETMPKPDIRVETHLEASEQMARLLQRLNDYLGLTAVVALFLAGVGAGFLFRSYFQKKLREVAILSTLGLSKSQGALYYLLQVLILGMFSAWMAIGLSFAVAPVVKHLTASLLPFSFDYSLTASTVVVSLVVATMGSVSVCLPFLSQIRHLSPSALLSDFQSQSLRVDRVLGFTLIPGLLLFVWLSIWQANSWKTGLVFVAAFILAGALLAGLGYALLWALEKWPLPVRSLLLKWAVRDLARDKVTSISCFLALGLGASLLNLIPQVRATLKHELMSPETSLLPSLFMFDVQEDQLDDVKTVFASQGKQAMQISPMIRARLQTLNGRPFDKGEGEVQGMSREEQEEMRFRNRGFNLSYRETLSEAERIVAGEPIVGSYVEGQSDVPLVSVEERFAERLNLKIGDLLEFEIEGVPVKGRIANLRSVKWTSFQPNFFVQFQPGALELAPKTFIITVGPMTDAEKIELQKKMVEKVPNISIIDVSQLVAKISELISQMSLALQAMAILCLLAGFVVIFSIVSHQMEKRRWQTGLYKVLGAPFSLIRSQIHIQYLVLTLTSAMIGIGVSILFSYLLSSLLFKNVWVFDWLSPAISSIVIIMTTIGVVSLASTRYLNQKPKSLLGSS